MFTSSVPKEFKSYYDEKFGREVTSLKQEERLMKKHKQIYSRDAFRKFNPRTEAAIDKKKWEMRKGLVA